MVGGDDLEENFVLDSDNSSTGEDSVDDTTLEPYVEAHTPDVSRLQDRDSLDESDEPQSQAKKVKLNWREASAKSAGSSEDQLEILRVARLAFEKFFPSSTLPFNVESLSANQFLDLSEYTSSDSKNTQDLFASLRSRGFLNSNTDGEFKSLRTLIVTSSATRGMYLVKELKSFDKSLSPLPLFFHGGGRKKEQSQTHETVIKGGRASVAVCLPSRLKAVTDAGLLDFGKVDIVVFDLKQNEKRLNVLSMKDTMSDCLDIIGRCVSADNGHTLLSLI